jgi:hypothetical protein
MFECRNGWFTRQTSKERAIGTTFVIYTTYFYWFSAAFHLSQQI